MVNKNTEAQVKAQLIQRINARKSEAIFYGFNYPTQPLESVEYAKLLELQDEVRGYILNAVIEEFTKEENGKWVKPPKHNFKGIYETRK